MSFREADEDHDRNWVEVTSPGLQTVAVELDVYAPSSEELGSLVGRYHSRELDVSYEIEVDGNGACLAGRRGGRRQMRALDKDTFKIGGEAPADWFSFEVTFRRDDADRVFRMDVTAGRVTNLGFDRV